MIVNCFSLKSFLEAFEETKTYQVAGVMSGTSMDGVDVAIAEFAGSHFKLIGLRAFDYPQSVQAKLRDISALTVRGLAELHTELGKIYADCVARAQTDLGAKVDLVGCHGQTVYHHSCMVDAPLSTLQLGDGDQLATSLGVPVVFDFRSKDIALGGQGAPLVCYGDWVFFESLRGRGAVLNVGGIANVTFLSELMENVVGFDTGPGNSVLDRSMALLTAGRELFDQGGLRASKGTADRLFVDRLLESDAFINQVPPKSTGFEAYGDAFVERVIREFGRLDEDLVATLTLFVAKSISLNIRRFAPFEVDSLIIAGGGGFNSTLLEWIRKELPGVAVELSDTLGVPAKAREALCFALFAYDFFRERQTSIANVTGAQRSAVLGKLCIP